MVKREIGVRERLRLYTLRGVDDKHRALTRRQRARDLIVKIDMTGGIDKVELIDLPVERLIVHLDRVGLYGDSAFTFEIHIVKYLRCHITLCHGVGELQKPIRQS